VKIHFLEKQQQIYYCGGTGDLEKTDVKLFPASLN
jgi:hypothetical protein